MRAAQRVGPPGVVGFRYTAGDFRCILNGSWLEPGHTVEVRDELGFWLRGQFDWSGRLDDLPIVKVHRGGGVWALVLLHTVTPVRWVW